MQRILLQHTVAETAPSPETSFSIRFMQILFVGAVMYYLWRLHKRQQLLPLLLRAKDIVQQHCARNASSSTVNNRRAPDVESGMEMPEQPSFQPKFLGLQAGESPLLTKQHVRELCNHLPSRVVGKDWQLLFSTSQDGYDLHNLYAKVRHRGPTVLVVMDDKSHIFGGFASRDWSGNDLVTASMPYSYAMAAVRAVGGRPTTTASYFGSGESFIFTAHPTFQVFRWTRKNNLFLLARSDSIAFGGGGGKFGLYLDSTLDQGSSGSCETYGNSPLASTEMFKVIRVEVWGFTLPTRPTATRGGAR